MINGRMNDVLCFLIGLVFEMVPFLAALFPFSSEPRLRFARTAAFEIIGVRLHLHHPILN